MVRVEIKGTFELVAGPLRHNRQLFHTRKGFIGIGPGALREGDFVCVIFGGRVLYVLRKSLDKQNFVGECYVHGM
jgi:hypothetical protein